MRILLFFRFDNKYEYVIYTELKKDVLVNNIAS